MGKEEEGAARRDGVYRIARSEVAKEAPGTGQWVNLEPDDLTRCTGVDCDAQGAGRRAQGRQEFGSPSVPSRPWEP